MSGFWNQEDQSSFGQQANFAYNSEDVGMNTDQLAFHQTTFDIPKNEYEYSQYSAPQQMNTGYSGGFYDPKVEGAAFDQTTEFDDEPPLLEELGIDLSQISKKILVVLDPFTSTVPAGDYDLAGPLAFCIILAGFLLLSGGTAHFGYVYGLAMTSCLMMYALLNLMTTNSEFTLTSVASVLGYALLPVVFLSGIGVVFSLRTIIGHILAAGAVGWSSLAASRIFVTMSADREQRPLIAYPCILLYAVFTLLILF